MNWNQACRLIVRNITPGLHLDPRWTYKIIDTVPPYQCYRNEYNGISGFRVQVGAKSFIEVPLEVLREVHEYAILHNASSYSKGVFQYCFPNLYNQKPCYVHTVGKIFACAGVAHQVNNHSYQLL